MSQYTLVLSLLIGSFSLWAQADPIEEAAAQQSAPQSPATPQYDSRIAEIQAAQRNKARQLAPDIPSGTERAFLWVKDKKILERVTAGISGFRVGLGGLISGSGFTAGPEYLRRDLAHRNVMLRISTRLSTKRYLLGEAELALPHLANDHAFLSLLTGYRNSGSVNYYGPGPDSHKTGRSNYRLEDNYYDVFAGVRPIPELSLGATSGYLRVNVGPGTEDHFVSTEQIYSPAVTPGIDEQSNFLRGGVFARLDYRDNPGGPRRGGNYVAAFMMYDDRKFDRYSFRSLDVDLQQYIPFFNERRVIALRAKTVLSFPNTGQRVPFYLQPVLGGSSMLRGFRTFRFYDDNLLAFTGEYRWEIFSGLDAAIFADAGKVFHRRANLNFKDLESSVGFGLRFNVRNSVFMRIDTGFSHEGFQVWVKFDNVF